ncbi:MAG: TIR domain-containing protein [candidate division WOR-3 bacterium]
MARRVFFSFHYERDICRASQIRNSWITKPDRETAGFWVAASCEEVKKKGKETIKRWIDNQLNGTSVTLVLIGAETNESKWVSYEIQKSYQIGNGMLGIYNRNMKDQYGRTYYKGKNPFYNWSITRNTQKILLSSLYRTYDWVSDNRYKNLVDWVEKAAKDAGR